MRSFISHCITLAAAIGVCVLLTAPTAKAVPVSFAEGFSGAGSLPSPFLEQSTGGTAATFNGVNAAFPGAGSGGRSYLRTVADDYNTASFVADITVTLLSNGGNGVAFFGMGTGEPFPSFFNEPRIGPHIYMRPGPDNFLGGAINFTDQAVEIPFGGDLAGTGTHRLRMVWDAVLQQMTFAIDQDYTGGAFSATSTFGTFDGSNNGFGITNSRIFFGGTSGTTFDDLVVSVVPEPASLTMMTLGSLLLRRARRAG